jgi:hypothetical protein
VEYTAKWFLLPAEAKVGQNKFESRVEA